MTLRRLLPLILTWLLLAPAALAAPRTVVCLGDSLTEGYGVGKDEAYPALVQAELQRRGYKDVTVVNAGISGSTSASGPSRVKWLLKGKTPSVLVLALGANDGLRGLDLAALRKNLTETIELAKKGGVGKILLAGMMIPPSYGKTYADGFAHVFPDVAKAEGVTLLPFLLAHVAAESRLNQPDGIHPNAAGHKIVAKTVAEALVPLLGAPDKP